ncbi:hypothetical protein [Kocuria tytonicola]|uniref:hypothetical protein n=1 Tax=Kocuria tytonicola TaxID=2055946 RepID=UPI000F544278|nr:hypothetical protein [Kocuria tytonicola]
MSLNVLSEGATFGELVKGIDVNDIIIMGTDGSSPRTSNSWSPSDVGRSYMLQVTQNYYVGQNPIWHDEFDEGSVKYPNRIDFELIDSSEDSDSIVDQYAAQSLKLSANIRSAPIPINMNGKAGASALRGQQGAPLPGRLVFKPWAGPNSSTYMVQSKSITPRMAQRIEFQLQSEFGEWLTGQGYAVENVDIPSLRGGLAPDLYCRSLNIVVEAKKSPTRENVRMAIGQVLDYQQSMNTWLGASTPDVEPAILLPAEPSSDLKQLLTTLGIQLYVRDSGDGFTRAC